MKAAATHFALAASEPDGCQDVCDALPWRGAWLGVVADGVGRADNAGEAARKVVASLVENFKARPAAWSLRKALEEFTRLLNRTLFQESLARHERVEMLTTLAVVALEGERLTGLNVGDSRVYHFRAGQLTRLSHDHVEAGAQLQHVLTRAMGMTADVSPHVFETAVAAGDLILLCSDGVTNTLADPDLAALLARRSSARTIVAAAREKATDETLDDASAVVMEILETNPNESASHELEIPDTLAAGQTFDGCTLVRPFNQNERTWLATRGAEKLVLKFAPREARHSEAHRNQFVQEIWSLTRLQADYFIRAFVPENNRTLCYGMEYLEAPTLKDFLRAGPLAVADAVALTKFLLNACQFLLRFDLAHGDLKPENILVLREHGALRFKLIDFGSVGEVFTVTSRAGTPSYLAPERFGGAPLTEGTEVFALGVVLHEALTGAFPYGEIEPFQTPAFRAAKRPSQLNPNVPPWLDAVVLRAVAPRPEERYQAFSEMKFDLENPTKVQPWFPRDASLLERSPLRFYKVGFFLLLATNLYLLFRLLACHAGQ